MITCKKTADFDVTGIGSPLVDYIVNADDMLLSSLSLSKGGMRLIDEAESAKIMAGVSDRVDIKVPGGSAANTLSAVAMLGGSSAFMGSIGADKDGKFYVSETEKSGVKSFLRTHDALTGHAITFITSDGERTFATHLGAATRLSKEDIDKAIISRSKVLHIEGYILESPVQREAAEIAMRYAKDAGVLVSIDAADPGVVTRNKEHFARIAKEYADILFLNEEEAQAFTGKTGEASAKETAHFCKVAVVKLGASGSVVVSGCDLYRIKGFSAKVENTNGAGDVYAAGFLYGLTHGYSLEESGTIGSFCASRVVEERGARLSKKPDISSVLGK